MGEWEKFYAAGPCRRDRGVHVFAMRLPARIRAKLRKAATPLPPADNAASVVGHAAPPARS